MVIQQVAYYPFQAHEAKVSRKKFETEAPPRITPSSADSFEPANGIDRDKLLRSIKSKIKGGFYNSEAVLDDLSHSMAKIFDQSL
jgi:hypothetical protein